VFCPRNTLTNFSGSPSPCPSHQGRGSTRDIKIFLPLHGRGQSLPRT